MLNVINRYCHGYVAVPVIIGLKAAGFFRFLSDAPVSLDTLIARHHANSGHLLVALRMLESISWVKRVGPAQYAAGPRVNDAKVVDDTIAKLYDQPSGSDFFSIHSAHYLNRLFANSEEGWGVDDEWFADFIDGPLYVPLLLHLRQHLFETGGGHAIRNVGVPVDCWLQMVRVFRTKEWVSSGDSDQMSLSQPGTYLMQRMMNAGTVYSYRPMLANVSELLFGTPASVFTYSQQGHEEHIDRTMNVTASGFQHEKYFRDVDAIIALSLIHI